MRAKRLSRWLPAIEGTLLVAGLVCASWYGLRTVDIPSIRLSASIVDTDDDEALGFAVGYLPDTPPPWAPGNTVSRPIATGCSVRSNTFRRATGSR
jgi:hypothetical protein